jgi:thioredoxin reductase (NADPH)
MCDGGTSQPLGHGIAEPPDRNGAHPRLGDEQRARLRAFGETIPTETGQVLFREGDDRYDFFVVESGAVAIVQGYECENRVIAVHGAHRFLGELNMLTGERTYLTAVVRDPGEVTRVPVERLRTLVRDDDDLGNTVLRAFLARRAMLIERGAGVRVAGSRFSRDSQRLVEFLARNRVPYQWLDLDEDEEADTLVRALAIPPEETPVVIGAGGVLRNPSNGELAALLGLGSAGPAPAMCDLVIVGGGPAGLAAAVYGASEGLDTQAIDAVAFGGQASTSSRIENYLGFPQGISGSELAERAALQAAKFGARLVVPAEATSLRVVDGHYTIEVAGREPVNGRTVIIATGAHYRKLAVPDLERFEGLDVYYAATATEAQRCSGDHVVIVGGGNSAGQAAMFLSQHAGSCRLLIRGGDIAKSMSHYLIAELERNPRVTVETHSEIVELDGEERLERAVVRDPRTGATRELETRAVFVFIGADPHTDWLRGQVAMDDHGFLLTGADVQGELLATNGDARPLLLETSLPGVFAVGDVHSGSIKRCASAVGEGSMAVQLVHRRLAAR